MDTKDISYPNARERISRRKLWAILVVAAVFFGMYGSYRLMQTGKIQEWGIANTLKLISLEEKRLSKIEKNIKEAKDKHAGTDDLMREREKSIKEIERLKKELELWKRELGEVGMQSMRINIRPQLPNITMNNAYAAEQETNDESKKSNSMSHIGKQELRQYVLLVILVILAVVYLIVNYKVWFSSNEKNMELASDLMKTITGFWIGLGTAAF